MHHLKGNALQAGHAQLNAFMLKTSSFCTLPNCNFIGTGLEDYSPQVRQNLDCTTRNLPVYKNIKIVLKIKLFDSVFVRIIYGVESVAKEKNTKSSQCFV